MKRLLRVDGTVVGEGAFSPGLALWVGKREIAHLDGEQTLDVRLTRTVIASRRLRACLPRPVSICDVDADFIDRHPGQPEQPSLHLDVRKDLTDGQIESGHARHVG